MSELSCGVSPNGGLIVEPARSGLTDYDDDD